MIYQWKDGSRKPGSAQTVGEALDRVRTANEGRLAPRDVVVAAQKSGSPLHRYFEWQDNIAATKYRDGEARELIRSLVVIHEDMPDKLVAAFVCIEQGSQEFGAYQATHIALANCESREYVLARALRELEAWKKKYADLSELAGVIACIDANRQVSKAA